MTRPLRVGDRVTATGTVINLSSAGLVKVVFDDNPNRIEPWMDFDSLTLIAPVEPPVGSVVVKDGVAWVHANDDSPTFHWMHTVDESWTQWDDISDGDVIFTPGGDSDVG